MRQFVVLVSVSEVFGVPVQVKYTVILLYDILFCRSGSLACYDMQLLLTCRNHPHKLHAGADGCLAGSCCAFEKISRNIMNAVYKVDIFRGQGETTLQVPHRRSERRYQRVFQRS